MKNSKKIGFIGLGIMGKPMAKNLIKNNYKINVYNRTKEKCIELEHMGATVLQTIKEISELSDVIITMLENEKAMDEVCFSDDGVINNLQDGDFLINMSTVSVNYTEKLKKECNKKNIKFLDCPVSGSKPLAENQSLIILCGSDKNYLSDCKDILLSMGKDIVYCGEAPNGTILKLSINLLIAAMTTGLVESFMLAEKSSINPALIFETISKSPAINCGYFKMKEKNLIEKDFSPAFSLKNMLKDVNFMIDLSKADNLVIRMTERVKEIFEDGVKKGYSEEDLTSIIKTY
ncbi:MAG: NAD(P)-dependent oxidoreductase [Elusimicrobiales bacterium]|nr:NAD(P)-dependent oxidoreductase [Elusimicrobiales bacterium]NLH39236.1 NAD(P)-dependent oxidoreductase [Elusimicrobiota bacterium]